MPLIRTITVAPGEPVVIPATHVERGENGDYRVVLGIGRQTPATEAARA
ncbi:hypothetical protein [Microbacterium stercoris]|uniref:Uncharacterized protein n=1 Tax=Microbacterium stercoris TaxID=2820289 RepID=A0A939QM66_9MICO|nr:hypothetical protein [Microbacterium stercoris]MBO3664790.1 hypothetical protein [Microbacterium stercoris]